MSRKSLDERLEELHRQRAQLEARHAALVAVKKGADRKRDTRRKIVVGAAILAQAERSPDIAAWLGRLLDQSVTREIDRKAIADLLPTPAATDSAAA